MEHEDEVRIKEKVKQFEEAAVTWDRARVWSAVGVQPARTTSLFVFYYAAASLALAAAVLFYSQQQTYRDELHVRMGEIELALAKIKTSGDATNSRLIAEFTDCPEPETSVPVPTTTQHKMQTPIKRERNTNEVRPADPPAVAQIPLITVKPEEIVSPQVETVSTTKIAEAQQTKQAAVILGRSISIPASQTATKNRIRFTIFKGENEMAVTPSSTPVTTLASINNQ